VTDVAAENLAELDADEQGRRTAFGLPLRDLGVVLYGFLLPVAFGGVQLMPYQSAKVAVTLPLVVPALVVLVRFALRRDRGSLFAAGFLAVLLMGALLAETPRLAILGRYGVDYAWLYLAAYFGCWALGRYLSPEGRRALPWAIVAGLAVSGVVGVVQLFVDVSGILPSFTGGRANGLTDNPVFLGSQMAGLTVLALAMLKSAERRVWYLAGAVAVGVLALQLSGSRGGLIGAVVGGAVPLVRLRAGRLPVALVAIAAGVLLSLVPPQTSSVGDRLSGGSEVALSGTTARLEAWESAVGGFLERPLLGWGPGGYRQGTAHHLDPEFPAAEGQDRLFFDAHNLVFQMLVVGGLIGAALLAGFVACAAWPARGPMAWFVLAVAITWLLQPASIHTVPLVMLGLGAAGRPAPQLRPARTARAVSVVGAVAGLLAGAALLIGDHYLLRFSENPTYAALDRAERWFLPDPLMSDYRAQMHAIDFAGSEDPTDAAKAVAAAEATIDLDPSWHLLWVRLGDIQQVTGERQAAKASYQEALKRYPWSERAWAGLRWIAVNEGDRKGFEESQAAICRIGSPRCADQLEPEPAAGAGAPSDASAVS
jgi:O-antigen ligase